MARAYPESARIKPARPAAAALEPSGPRFTIVVWKLPWRSRRARGPGPRSRELRSGQRFEGRYACVRKDRLTARNGGAYLSLELRDRTGTLAARVFREADRIGLRFERGRRGPRSRQARALQAASWPRSSMTCAGWNPGRSTRASSCPAAYRSVEELEGFLEHLTREVHDPGLRAVVERLIFAEPLAAEFRRAPCTRGGHHAYLGGLLEHTVSVGTLVGELCQLHPAARLRPADGGGARSRRRQDARVHLRGRVRGQRGGPAARPSGDRSADGRAPRRASSPSRAPAGAAPLRALPSRARGRPRRARQGAGSAARGFASAEALALYRLNALDASVKGALEHGL